MNKQELIDKYNTKKANLRPYCPNRNRKEEQLKSTIYTNIIDDLKQLDEPQKKVIPKCAHEFILEGTDLGLSYFEIITSAESFANAKPQDEFSKWLRKNSGLFIRSLLNGYEVEKEQLYYVYFPEIIASPEMFFPDIEGAYLMKSDDGIELADNNDFEDMKFTEREIKAIDERYWAFAVPVEEPLYCVKIGKGYFSGFDDTKVTYVIDDAPGALAQRVKYETREEAEMDAIQIGGTVEEVRKDEQTGID